jgi:hypothetical protein
MKNAGKTTVSGQAINWVGRVGLAFSIAGLVSLFLLGPWRYEPIRYLTLCSLIGLVVSIAALFCRPRRTAKWGAVLGLIGTFYLPTVFLPVLRQWRGTQQDGAANRIQPAGRVTNRVPSEAASKR